MSIMKTVAAAVALTTAAVTFSAPAEANANDAIIAGAAGFAVGTLFGNATARPRYVAPRPVYVQPRPVYVTPRPVVVYGSGYADWLAYCSAKYRSFNPNTGLYLGFDGHYHPCRM
jgi:hypothetical protein